MNASLSQKALAEDGVLVSILRLFFRQDCRRRDAPSLEDASCHRGLNGVLDSISDCASAADENQRGFSSAVKFDRPPQPLRTRAQPDCSRRVVGIHQSAAKNDDHRSHGGGVYGAAPVAAFERAEEQP